MAPSFLSEITGSFAYPAAENPTVAMVEAAYRHHKLDFRYLNCEVRLENLGDAVKGARAMKWAGFHCSIPHKVSVIAHLDGLGKSAEIIGAVNTIVRRDGKYFGENTDGRGFVKAMREVIDPSVYALGIEALAIVSPVRFQTETIPNTDKSLRLEPLQDSLPVQATAAQGQSLQASVPLVHLLSFSETHRSCCGLQATFSHIYTFNSRCHNVRGTSA